MVLTLEYRPHTFADVVGQKHVVPVLRAMVKRNDPPPVLIFGGSRGTGKTTTARILAAALNCLEPSEDGDSCGQCAQCLGVQQSSSMAVLEVDAASNGGVENVRKIRDMCLYATEGRWRVVLLDEAHSMSKEAFNALLKLLEQPPPATLFVLLTTEVDKIIETVQSRAMSFEFRRLSIADIVGRLNKISYEEEIECSSDLLVEIANRAQGGMRDAIMLLDQCQRVGVTTVEQFRELNGISNVAVDLLRAAIEQDMSKGFSVLDEHFSRIGDAAGVVSDLVLLVRDLLVLRAGGVVDCSAEALKERESLVKCLTGKQLTSVIRLLWDLKDRTRAVADDQRSAMVMAFVLLSELLAKTAEVAPEKSAQDSSYEKKKLSLDEMVSLAR